MKLVSLALRLILAGLISLIPRSPQVDPGIQLVPEKRGDPRVAVKPRDRGPGLSTIPDLAPPSHQGINPPGGGA